MREPVAAERPKSIAYRFFYGFIIALIAVLWIYAFKTYFGHYESIHPKITWASSWIQKDIVPIDGILLWNEDLLMSPIEGTVKYPLGTGPLRVPKGAIVARVSSGSFSSDVKSRNEGYFIAGLDGSEGHWRYSELWTGTQIPEPKPVKIFKDGEKFKKNSPIGKIIPQPQTLRLIGLVALTEGMKKELASGTLKVKMDPLDTHSQAELRVHEELGSTAKVYLNVPWFPPEVLTSRNYRLLVQTGETSGLTIPESAVAFKDGKMGAFVLKGAEAVFTEIRGRAIDDSKFLVVSGLKLGDAVVLQAEGAREGRVRLW